MEAAERAMAGKQDRGWHPKGGPQLSMTLALGTTSRAATAGKYACVLGYALFDLILSSLFLSLLLSPISSFDGG
ncbi:hypothetical protein B296_00051469 [Ensete ventricosum]|uniref:Uncharacterized protein n=1 Tax=Ensete ventricosum TaxID=4639 RepID=A0A426YGJ1_ENSVE|nr:hypothetical protein B296_00051469 [Ensete ventricosum]